MPFTSGGAESGAVAAYTISRSVGSRLFGSMPVDDRDEEAKEGVPCSAKRSAAGSSSIMWSSMLEVEATGRTFVSIAHGSNSELPAYLSDTLRRFGYAHGDTSRHDDLAK